MANPVYRLYYGKYPDHTPNEIPNDHIKSMGPVKLRIEPGKPAEPKVDSIPFTLENKNWDDTERYDRDWITEQSRSEAEGATSADQLFFKIDFTESSGYFIGQLDGRKYSTYRDTVDFTIKNTLGIITNSDKGMFKPFTFNDCRLSEKTNNDEFSTGGLPHGTDLEGTDLTDEYLRFEVVLSTKKVHVPFGDLPKNFSDFSFHHPYVQHRGLNAKLEGKQFEVGDPPEATIWGESRLAFVSIGDITLLTRLRESIHYYQDTNENLQLYFLIEVNHAANGNYDLNGSTVLERGRFFADQQGTDLKQDERYSITIIDYDVGANSNDIIMPRDYVFDVDGFPPIMNGYEIHIYDGGTYDIANTPLGYFDMLKVFTEVIENNLLLELYKNNPPLFDIFSAGDQHRHAFWADILLYGWNDKKPGEMLVNLATQLNCYVFFNDSGQIVFQNRLLHQNYLPEALPPGCFEVDIADIKPLGYDDSNNGFDSYSVQFNDRIPINNLVSDDEQSLVVDKNGVRESSSLRQTDITIENYRTDDLGVPVLDDPVDQLVLRYSPDDPDFDNIYTNGEAGLEHFLPIPEDQAQGFAGSYQYPVEQWSIQWDISKYAGTRIGAYFWTVINNENVVYFIKELTYDFDQYLYKMNVQRVGVWNG